MYVTGTGYDVSAGDIGGLGGTKSLGVSDSDLEFARVGTGVDAEVAADLNVGITTNRFTVSPVGC